MSSAAAAEILGIKNISNASESVKEAMIVDFLITIIEDLVYVIQLTAEALVEIPTYLGWMPSIAVSALVTLFRIVIVYKVLGREG